MDLGTDTTRSVFNDSDEPSGSAATRNISHGSSDIRGLLGEHNVCQAATRGKILCCY
jgi:hypothetical protein